MRKRDYIVGAFSFLLLCFSAGLLVYSGCLRDAYMDLEMPAWLDVGLWALLAVDFILFAGCLSCFILKAALKEAYQRFSGILLASFLICFVLNAVCSCSFYSFASGHKIFGGADYIADAWLQGVSLEDMEELMADARDDVVVYIGREDSRECKEFEKDFSRVLEEHSVITPTYFTDREQGDSEELAGFLANYGIDGVPCVFFISGGEVVQKWDRPLESISEIEAYL